MKAIEITTEKNGVRETFDSIKQALENYGLFTTRISYAEGVKKLLRNGVIVLDNEGNPQGEVVESTPKKERVEKPVESALNADLIRDLIRQEIRSAIGSDEQPRRKGVSVIQASTIQEALQRYAVPNVANDSYYVSDDVWKEILYAFKTNKPILLTGPSGTGKTDLVRVIGSRLGLSVHSVDCSAMDDAVEGFIGRRELKDGNTSFEPSKFSEAIACEQIVLLDEVSRAPRGANNILFPLLDHRPTLVNPYGKDVSAECFFIATANEGTSFTGTITLDEAFRNRFYVINIDYAPQSVETEILVKRDGINKSDAERITGIAKQIRERAASGELTRSVSLRELFLASEQLAFGFPLEDALDNAFVGGFQVDEQFAIRDLIRTN